MKKGAKWGLGCLGLTALCGVSAVLIPGMMTANALTEEIRRAKAAGVPLTVEELNQSMPPDSENAAAEYKQLISLHRSEGLEDLRVAYKALRTRSDAAAARAQVHAAWKKHPEFERVLEAGLAKSSLRFKRDWAKHYLLQFPEYSDLRTINEMLGMVSMACADSGDSETAMRYLSAMKKLSSQIAQDPTIIAGLSAHGAQGSLHRAARHYLATFYRDKGALSAMHTFATQLEPVHDLRYHFRSEIVGTHLFFQALPKLSPAEYGQIAGGEDSQAFASAFKIRGIRDAVHASVLRHHREIWTDLSQNPTSVDNLAIAMQRADKRVMSSTTPIGTLSSVFMPVFSGYANSLRTGDARWRLLQTATRLLERRLESGEIPKALPEMGESGEDPFTGSPFLFNTDGKSFTLYSVGADAKDDGGHTPKDVVLEWKPAKP